MTTRTSRKSALKEDIKHVIEELWDLEEEEALYKIFTKEFLGAKSTQDVMRHSKVDLKDLSDRNEDDDVLYLHKCDVGKSA